MEGDRLLNQAVVGDQYVVDTGSSVFLQKFRAAKVVLRVKYGACWLGKKEVFTVDF